MRVLYLSYNGLLDPLGQSQVLQYLIGLAGRGHRIVLVTYEKPDEWSNEEHRTATRDMTTGAGIRWIPLSYHRRPKGLAISYDLLFGLIVAVYVTLRHRVQVVHARGYVVAPIGLLLKWLAKVAFLFDPRSSWPDERVELGIWQEGSASHRFAKWLEKQLFLHADTAV